MVFSTFSTLIFVSVWHFVSQFCHFFYPLSEIQPRTKGIRLRGPMFRGEQSVVSNPWLTSLRHLWASLCLCSLSVWPWSLYWQGFLARFIVLQWPPAFSGLCVHVSVRCISPLSFSSLRSLWPDPPTQRNVGLKGPLFLCTLCNRKAKQGIRRWNHQILML